MRYVVIAVLIVIGVPVAGFVAMMWQAFVPRGSIEYSAELTATFRLNGEMLTAKRVTHCQVVDQRGTIAQSSFHTKSEGEAPYFLRPDGSIIIVSGIPVCLWYEKVPTAGETLKLAPVLGGGLFPQPSRELAADERPIRGSVVVVDNVNTPRHAKVIGLSSLATQPIAGLQLVSLRVTPTTAPVSPPTMAQDFPFLARVDELYKTAGKDAEKQRALRTSARIFTVSASYAAPRKDGMCHGKTVKPPPSGPGWIAVDLFDGCTGGLTDEMAARVASNLAQIDLAPGAPKPIGADIVFIDAAAREGVGMQRRSTHPEFDDWNWTPQVCVEGQCFTANFGAGIGYLELYNSSRNQYIQVVANPAWAHDLTE